MALVVVEKLKPADYAGQCAALPRDYGTPAWEERLEVREIRRAVFAALDTLETETVIGARIAGKPVLVKPNLVTVYENMGLQRKTYPESTDPRVLDAVVLWLSARAASVTIVESSGRGAPTRGSFRVAGIDRLARHRGTGLLALDECPVDRYFLPKAQVQREILVPRAFSAVVRGEAAYVSVPKLKTNLYTGVTLGFKNAMGVIPYNLRQRSHHHAIDRKLVEMLYLFKPDLVLIDGVVGGEGECPAPVDPVDARLIIAGDQSVETDRIATRLMGFDPKQIELMRVADKLGFGDPEGVRVIARGFEPGAGDPELGGAQAVTFRPADWSLLSARAQATCPRVTTLIGIDLRPEGERAAILASAAATHGRSESEAQNPGLPRRLEASCRGGCVATTRFALSMFEHEGIGPGNPVTLILGGGYATAAGLRWYDAAGRAYDEEAIRALSGRKAVIGACARRLAPCADRFVDGCMPLPNAPHAVLHELAGKPCRVMSLRNAQLLPLLACILGQRAARRRLIKAGEWLDVPLSLNDGAGPEGLPPTADEGRSWVAWPLPPMGSAERSRILATEDDAAVAALRGVFVPGLKRRVRWRITAIATGALTLATACLAAASAAGIPLPGSTGTWLFVFAGIEALHAAEIPASLGARRRFAERRGRPWTRRAVADSVFLTLAIGYPAWLPHRRGVFD